MVIKASSRRTVDALIDDLASNRPAAREAAVARLTVMGARAVERLSDAATDLTAGPDARAAALRALEGIRDPHAIGVAVQTVRDSDPVVACAGIQLASAFLSDARGLALVDEIAKVAVDTARPSAVRVAGVRALQTLSAATIAPLVEALANDPDPEIAALATPPRAARRRGAAARGVLEALDAGRLPDDADALRQAMKLAGRRMTLPALHRLVVQIREREGVEAGARRAQWMIARGAVHAALAARGSRLAVYDLRESLDAATQPLPVEMLTALGGVGDGSCLDSIASAYTRVTDEWWRRHLADAFGVIVRREQLLKRSPRIARIGRRWPQALVALWPAAPRQGR